MAEKEITFRTDKNFKPTDLAYEINKEYEVLKRCEARLAKLKTLRDVSNDELIAEIKKNTGKIFDVDCSLSEHGDGSKNVKITVKKGIFLNPEQVHNMYLIFLDDSVAEIETVFLK
jgi:hypothetical protein